MNVRIRPLTSADQPFVTEMQYEALYVPPGGVAPPRDVLDDPNIARYHIGLGSRTGDVGVVAVSGDRPLGAAWARLVADGYGSVDPDTPELGIAVVADQRGRGIGSQLLAALIDLAPRLSLSADQRNPAVRLYERYGFEVVRIEGDHSVVMVRSEP